MHDPHLETVTQYHQRLKKERLAHYARATEMALQGGTWAQICAAHPTSSPLTTEDVVQELVRQIPAQSPHDTAAQLAKVWVQIAQDTLDYSLINAALLAASTHMGNIPALIPWVKAATQLPSVVPLSSDIDTSVVAAVATIKNCAVLGRGGVALVAQKNVPRNHGQGGATPPDVTPIFRALAACARTNNTTGCLDILSASTSASWYPLLLQAGLYASLGSHSAKVFDALWAKAQEELPNDDMPKHWMAMAQAVVHRDMRDRISSQVARHVLNSAPTPESATKVATWLLGNGDFLNSMGVLFPVRHFLTTQASNPEFAQVWTDELSRRLLAEKTARHHNPPVFATTMMCHANSTDVVQIINAANQSVPAHKRLPHHAPSADQREQWTRVCAQAERLALDQLTPAQTKPGTKRKM